MQHNRIETLKLVDMAGEYGFWLPDVFGLFPNPEMKAFCDSLGIYMEQQLTPALDQWVENGWLVVDDPSKHNYARRWYITPAGKERIAPIYCADCGALCVEKGFSTGYGTRPEDNAKICYECCGKEDQKRMQAEGKIMLYLTEKKVTGRAAVGLGDIKRVLYTVQNWPGSLKFPAVGKTWSSRGWGGEMSRTDVWFIDAEGNHWYGRHQGDFNQIVHCRKLKHPIKGLESMIAIRKGWESQSNPLIFRGLQ